ncbi:hypothetical protein CDL15_Pgr005071 [Punica granatum]|uniref:Uncharacterized protein n=1 Tax=Punica granatum TaxID=22663 RepID=A0A218XZ96_PUNGR|nr:hypothetical protein CDL15_Pgr005071 [Punica granatum]
MAEEDRVDISEEVNPPAPAHSQPPPTYAPPPPTPAGVLPAYSGAPSTHLVSTPFWPTGFVHENPRTKPGFLFITRRSEANIRAQRHELQEKSRVH